MTQPIYKKRSGALVVCCWLLVGAARPVLAQDGEVCGDPFQNGVGPFDYTNPIDVEKKIPVVEQYHFNSDVENLVRGQTSAYLIEDLDYVLRAVPNHHRALYSMARYQLLRGSPDPRFRSAECYFDRAMRFRPGDATVRIINGIYLTKKGDRTAALKDYQAALQIEPGSAEGHYNIGLLYVDLGDFVQARQHAWRAYELGYPLQGLRRKLERAGQWQNNPAKLEAKRANPS